MAYANQSNVEAEFKDVTFTTTTTVKAADVSAFIEEAEAYINAKISGRYEVPVTAVDALPLLRMISVSIVKCRIEKILAVKAPIDPTKQATDSPDCYKRWDAMLDDIAKGKLQLPGAETSGTGGGFDSYTYANDIETTFHTDSDDW